MAMSQFSSPPTVANILNTEDIYKAVSDFVALCANDVPRAAIYAGYQNRESLPANHNEYVVCAITNCIEHGTPVVSYSVNEGRLVPRVTQLEELVIQIDCYSKKTEKARLRAQTVKTVARTPFGVDFFKQYGISSLYAEELKNTTVVVDAKQYVQRWMTVLHLSYNHVVELDVDSFNAANVEVVNVDVRFPPQ